LGNNPNARVYDVGCGIGRHTVFLASCGYQVYASDISAEARVQTRSWLSKEGLSADLRQGHFLTIDYPDNFFDLVISINTLNHGVKQEVYQIMQKIWAMLKPGGHFEGTLRIKDKDTPFYSRDVQILDTQTIVMLSGEERGVPHFFAYLEELPRLFQGFEYGDDSFVYIKILSPPLRECAISGQKGSEMLRFSVKKPQIHL